MLNLRGDEYLTPEERTLIKDTDWQNILADGGRLYRKVDKNPVRYIAKAFRRDFIESYHKHYGHYSASSRQGTVRYRGWWKSMQKDISQFAQQCRECQLGQKPKKGQEEPFSQVRMAAKTFEKWAIDFIGPLPVTPHLNG
ncbi:hypothetical protein LTR93_011169 [Exophiala xenobiotica]|nr:hypothetical protein LTR93_011169 [Exophiala xenobiotica]